MDELNRAASMEIWDWNGERRQAQRAAMRRKARIGGVIQCSVGLAVGGLLFYFGHKILAAVVASISLGLLFTCLLSPTGVYAKIAAAFLVLGEVVGAFLSYLLLTPLYFTFFTAFGVMFRRGKRNKMCPKFDKAAATYWTPRQPRVADRTFYEEQF